MAEVNLDRIVKSTEHFSGADLAHVCTTAAERALALSMRDGRLDASPPGTGSGRQGDPPEHRTWFTTARNVVAFANTDGEYDDLSAYLRKNKKL